MHYGIAESEVKKMMASNGDFIRGCECCGQDSWVASEVMLKFSYGSKYDGETITLNLCSDCADMLFEQMSNGNTRRQSI